MGREVRMKTLIRVLGGFVILSLLWTAQSSAFLGSETTSHSSDYEPTRLIVKFTPDTKMNVTQSLDKTDREGGAQGQRP